jgi:hypothetical protein
MPQLSHKQVTLSSSTAPPFEASAQGGAEVGLHCETESGSALGMKVLSVEIRSSPGIVWGVGGTSLSGEHRKKY